MSVAVLLLDAKYPHNVGGAQRACALLGASMLFWTGARVPDPLRWPKEARLPREERMAAYRKTSLIHIPDFTYALNSPVLPGWVPVCVEVLDNAEDLRTFEHPPNALYIFGPEDGGVPQEVRRRCHRFVRIPTHDERERTPYNLSAAVNIVLYDRLCKRSME